jgi:ElaB/YqjD/DUF883 family membrane-anchored ribosome-binding protein
MADTASETGREGLVGQATSQVQEAASTAQEKAVELKEQGKGKLGETLDQRTTEAGGQAWKLAKAVRRSGEQLRAEGEDGQLPAITEGVADRMERLAGYLERTSGDDLLRDIENFTRRRPWIVAGVGLVVGLAASRFLKASSERRYGGSMQGRASSRGPSYGTYPETTGAGYAADEPLTRESFGVGR